MKSLIFMKAYIFDDHLILIALYQKYIANITFKQFIKWWFTLWVYNFIKKWEKKKKMIPFWRKKAEQKQNSATTMISADR